MTTERGPARCCLESTARTATRQCHAARAGMCRSTAATAFRPPWGGRDDLHDWRVQPPVVTDRVEDRQCDEQHAHPCGPDEDRGADGVSGDWDDLELHEQEPAH